MWCPCGPWRAAPALLPQDRFLLQPFGIRNPSVLLLGGWKWQGCGSEMFSGALTEVEKSQERGKKNPFRLI